MKVIRGQERSLDPRSKYTRMQEDEDGGGGEDNDDEEEEEWGVLRQEGTER